MDVVGFGAGERGLGVVFVIFMCVGWMPVCRAVVWDVVEEDIDVE